MPNSERRGALCQSLTHCTRKANGIDDNATNNNSISNNDELTKVVDVNNVNEAYK